MPSSIEAEEAEEIGVEHLLRDIALPLSSSGSLSSRVASQLSALKGLHARLVDIRTYLSKVVAGELPVNHQILYNLQDVFNLLPGGLTGSASATAASGDGRAENDVMGRSFRGATNDQMLVVYLSSLIRSVIALHNLCVPVPPYLCRSLADLVPLASPQRRQQARQLARRRRPLCGGCPSRIVINSSSVGCRRQGQASSATGQEGVMKC